jgi:DNA-binding MarR family transcriptional regulator
MGREAKKTGNARALAAPRLQPERHASFLVVALANRISASASRAYMRSFGVGVMEWRAIALLAASPGMSANQIAHASGIDKSSVSRAVQSLIRRRLVRASEDKSDNRRSLLFLTPEGLALHDRIIRSSLAREALLLTGFDEAERERLFGLLKRLTANMALVNAHDPSADV